MKSDKELRKIAKDIYNGLAYLSGDEKEIERAFPILLFAKESELPEDIGSLYEYYEKASPLGTESKPIFFSANFLTVKETQKIAFYLKEMSALTAAFDDEDEEEIQEPETEEDLDSVLDEMIAEIIPQLVEQGVLVPDKNNEVELDIAGLKKLLTKCITGEIDEETLSKLVTEMIEEQNSEESNVVDSLMQGLEEAVQYEQGTLKARTNKVSKKKTTTKKSRRQK